jgi:hypothetical protein
MFRSHKRPTSHRNRSETSCRPGSDLGASRPGSPRATGTSGTDVYQRNGWQRIINVPDRHLYRTLKLQVSPTLQRCNPAFVTDQNPKLPTKKRLHSVSSSSLSTCMAFAAKAIHFVSQEPRISHFEDTHQSPNVRHPPHSFCCLLF